MTKNIKIVRQKKIILPMVCVIGGSLGLVACSDKDPQQSGSSTTDTTSQTTEVTQPMPASQFDLTHWRLTLPIDGNSDGKVDNIKTKDLQNYIHEDFFYLDEQGDLVFTSPNRGSTTQNSSNTRSELRYMSRGANTSIKTHDGLNNFALASHPSAPEFASVGGKMEATLHVDHAPSNSNKPKHSASYSAVIGQIHAIKYKKEAKIDGFGYGNEPLKIIYKKWPNHETGSVYWNYERNLEKDNPKRTDISYLVWGKDRRDSSDPGDQGIALGEDFSYTVNVYEDTMYLTFDSPRLGTVSHQINLADNVDTNGEVDADDNPKGYTGDGHYFKAGVYNQCRAVPKKGEELATCPGTGNWETDQANGDYAQVSFSKLIVSEADPK